LNVLFNSLIADSEDNLQREILALQNMAKILECKHHQVIDYDTIVVCELLSSLFGSVKEYYMICIRKGIWDLYSPGIVVNQVYKNLYR
jgi:hypothetical protein